jgi:3-phosphoshikimate 1-carboxyvinyltransferase
VLGLVVDGVEVENVATTGKTLPDFPELWTGMLAGDVSAAPVRGRG